MNKGTLGVNYTRFQCYEDSCPAAYGRSYIFCNIFTFSNGCILLIIGSIYTKLGDFVKLGVLFHTMWINSC